jgi:hypothetical protein
MVGSLMEKDFGPSIRSGFEATGLYPFSVEKALSKLPAELEDREVETAVQRTLLKTLEDMRYKAPANKAAARPRRGDKLPAGAAYTCKPAGGDNEEEKESSSSSEEDEDEEEEARQAVDRIVEGLESSDEEGEVEADDPVAEEGEKEYPEFQAGSFVAAVYQKDWYIGKVLNKEEEPEAEEGDEYIIVSFMVQTSSDRNNFKWPNKLDILNMLKSDVLFVLSQPPVISSSTSSSRVNSFAIAWADYDKAEEMFRVNQAYYPTIILLFSSIFLMRGR